MDSRDEKLLKLLRLEVADKSPQSATAFAIFSLFSFFYSFGCIRFEWSVKILSICIMIVAVLRFFISKSISEKKNISLDEWKKMITLVWINSLCWSLIFSLGAYEHQFHGIHFVVITTFLTGFIASSLITLAYDPILFIPFQFILLLPQIALILLLHFTGKVTGALTLIIPYTMYIIYQLKQYKDFRTQLIQRFRYQLDLEHSNEELQKSQKALIDQTIKLVHTSRLAALGEMSAGIAHEVNNPLAIISGSMQQLDKSISRGEISKENILKLSAKSQLSVERVTRIIKGLRHFSQQSDSLPKITVGLVDIIEDTSSFCSEMLASKYISLNIDTIPPVFIECHPVQISQVLINLIKNAEDSLAPEKDPSLKWIRLSFKTQDQKICISVSNGGEKIPSEIQSKLFQPFFTTKPVGKGTGLGLSISHGIMKEHMGDLTFESDAENTTFSLHLPVK